MKTLRNRFLWFSLSSLLISNAVFAGENVEKKHLKRSEQPVEIKIVPWGPSQMQVDAAKVRVERDAAVQNELRGVKYRLIGFE